MTTTMPSKGLYLFFVIAGFFMGIIWGILALIPYGKMKDAIARNDNIEAWASAGKVRLFFIIGLVINILCFVGTFAARM